MELVKELSSTRTVLDFTYTGSDRCRVKKGLKDLKQLTSLDLSGTKVTGVGLKWLKDHRQLTTLDLSGAPVTDVGLDELKGLKKITLLDLGNRLTDKALRVLREIGLVAYSQWFPRGRPKPRRMTGRFAN